MEENNSKKILLTVLGVAILVVAVVGISFALFSMDKSTNANTIASGSITMSFSESTNGISITDALPMDEATALSTTDANSYFDFSVSTTATTKSDDGLKIPYVITVEKTKGDLNDSQIGINLQEKSGDTWVNRVSGDTTIGALTAYNGSTTVRELLKVDNVGTTTVKTDTYRLRIWLDKNQEANVDKNISQSYSLRVNVYANA